MKKTPIRIAFDIGGTFTDFVLEDGLKGSLHFWKILSTPTRPAEAVMRGIKELLATAQIETKQISSILHATTVATNAILERKGSPTALITTKGFRDVLILGRQKRYETYDLHLVKPDPLIPRRAIFEIDARMLHDGSVLRVPTEQNIDIVLDEIVEAGYESVAISLIHCYADPSHEQMLQKRCTERGLDLSLSLSSDVSARFREYERTSTVVANAYVKPIVGRYVKELQASLTDCGISAGLSIMQSNGGLVSPALASQSPIRIVESGPAAGVLLCRSIARNEGIKDVLTFDMGGTTAKLGAIDDGEPATLTTFEVDQVGYRKSSGLPLNIPAIELLEIGAGGGSIARADLGIVHIGPESAASEPGPACYGRGGAQPTVTDANVVLGYLNPETFNGGRINLDTDAARKVIAKEIGEPLDLDATEAAWGIHLMATASMERALRVVSVERGRDPRNYALIGFGGAGPIHATRLARSVGITKVIIPRGAGVGSAVGLLEAVPRFDVSITRLLPIDQVNHVNIQQVYADLDKRIKSELEQQKSGTKTVMRRRASVRYAGQGHEILIDVPDPSMSDADFITAFREVFNDTYKRTYGYCDADREIEAVDWQLVASLEEVQQSYLACAPGEHVEKPLVTRKTYFPEASGIVDCPIYERNTLSEDNPVDGPCIVEDPESTIVLLPGDRARVSAQGNLIIAINGASW